MCIPNNTVGYQSIIDSYNEHIVGTANSYDAERASFIFIIYILLPNLFLDNNRRRPYKITLTFHKQINISIFIFVMEFKTNLPNVLCHFYF